MEDRHIDFIFFIFLGGGVIVIFYAAYSNLALYYFAVKWSCITEEKNHNTTLISACSG